MTRILIASLVVLTGLDVTLDLLAFLPQLKSGDANLMLLTIGILATLSILGLYLLFDRKQRTRVAQERDLNERLEMMRAVTQAVLDNSEDGFISIDQEGKIRTYNKACETIFGYEPEEVIGQNVKELMPEPYRANHDQYLRNYQQTGIRKVISIGREVRGRRKGGGIFPLDLSISEVNVRGEVFYVGIVRDQTSEKETESRLKAIMDHTVDGLITIDEQGRIETFNTACENLFGYQAEEVVGQNVKVLMPEPYHSAHDGYIKSYHESGQKKIIGVGREVQGRRKDGTYFPLDLSVSEVKFHGRILYSGILRDVSERKAVNAKLHSAHSELEEFSYRTSHDLRSPLATALGLLKFADKSLKDDNGPVAEKTLGKAQEALAELDLLVENISILTKAKYVEEEIGVVDVQRVVTACTAKFAHMENFGRIEFETAFCGADTLATKVSRVELIVENLISNAIKYQDLTKPRSFVKVATYIDELGRYVVEVRDNGQGIPADDQAKLFSMFKRFHPKSYGGSGLGLYIIKQSADLIGALTNYEDLGEGSKFLISFPSSMLEEPHKEIA